MSQTQTHPPIRSFVLRKGRMTPAQLRGLAQDYVIYGIDIDEQRLEPLNWSQLFNREAPRILEIGFGMGDVLIEAACSRPETDFIGVEVHPPGVGRCIHLAKTNGLQNLKVCRVDIMNLIPFIPLGSFDEIWILFPDPWHKKRHQKRRLIQPDFIETLAPILKPNGTCRLATDWQEYADHMLSVFEPSPDFVNVYGSHQFAPPDPDRLKSKFQKRGERLGHDVWELVYQRR